MGRPKFEIIKDKNGAPLCEGDTISFSWSNGHKATETIEWDTQRCGFYPFIVFDENGVNSADDNYVLLNTVEKC